MESGVRERDTLSRIRSKSESLSSIAKSVSRPASLSMGECDSEGQSLSSYPQLVAESIAKITCGLIENGKYPQSGVTEGDLDRERRDVWKDGLEEGKGTISWRKHPLHAQELSHFKNICKNTNTWKKNITNGCSYARMFAKKAHTVFVGLDCSGSPIILTALKDKQFCKGIVWVKEGYKLVNVTQSDLSCWSFLFYFSKKVSRKDVSTIFAKTLCSEEESRSLANSMVKLKQSEILSESLIKLESDDYNLYSSKAFKVGLVYVENGRQSEESIFSNSKGSKEFNQFLHMMGSIVELKGFQGFSGGLDTVYNLTGTHSLYCCWRDECEIMFHVSTLLPGGIEGDSYISRKRFIGNDVCLLVFVDGPEEYDPGTIRSTVTHVVVVINAVKVDSGTRYKVTVFAKGSLPYFGPDICTSMWENGIVLRDLILEKLVNGRFAASQGDDFFSRMCKYRKLSLEKIMREQIRKQKGDLPVSVLHHFGPKWGHALSPASRQESVGGKHRKNLSVSTPKSHKSSLKQSNVTKNCPKGKIDKQNLESESGSGRRLLSENSGQILCDQSSRRTSFHHGIAAKAQDDIAINSLKKGLHSTVKAPDLIANCVAGLGSSSEVLEKSLLSYSEMGNEGLSSSGSTESSCLSTPCSSRKNHGPQTPTLHPGK